MLPQMWRQPSHEPISTLGAVVPSDGGVQCDGAATPEADEQSVPHLDEPDTEDELVGLPVLPVPERVDHDVDAVLGPVKAVEGYVDTQPATIVKVAEDVERHQQTSVAQAHLKVILTS